MMTGQILAGKRLGILGLGRHGSRVAQIYRCKSLMPDNHMGLWIDNSKGDPAVIFPAFRIIRTIWFCIHSYEIRFTICFFHEHGRFNSTGRQVIYNCLCSLIRELPVIFGTSFGICITCHLDGQSRIFNKDILDRFEILFGFFIKSITVEFEQNILDREECAGCYLFGIKYRIYRKELTSKVKRQT